MKKLSPLKICLGIGFTVLFVLTYVFLNDKFTDNRSMIVYVAELIFATIAISAFLPQKSEKALRSKGKLTKRTWLSILMVFVVIPATILCGVYLLDDRKFYFISLLVMLEIMLPFAISFEKRKPNARELILISVLCAIGVCGRTVFYMLPQFKPVLAIVIIAGVAFGGEAGFLVGAVTALVSNFFFGQGAWTPWQMFCYGIVGFIAGIVFQKGLLSKSRVALSLFGLFATVIIYGGVMNPASVLMYQPMPTWEMILSAYAMGFLYDLIFAFSTAFFLWIAGESLLEKLDRIKMKYGITSFMSEDNAE